MSVKVSIIIPTYNRPQLLKRCLKSLEFQNFPKSAYEIIVVTDGPDEETINVITESAGNQFVSNIRCYSLPVKKGPAAARNTGWKMAKGQLILFTDDDCIPAFDWIKTYYRAFEFYNETTIAFTGKIKVPTSDTPTDFELNTLQLETADFVTANCACSREALEKVNGFDEAFTMAWREHSDLEFRFLELGIQIKKIEKAVVTHPVRKAPWGISLKEQKKSMFNALLFKKHPQLYKTKVDQRILWNYYFMIIFLSGCCIALLYDRKLLALTCFTGWLILVSSFISKRLANASHSFKHVTEMIATSILIPFYSVFWNLYGACKFKIFRR
jgi:glycosyltransferase involved in cell wall biosynthesis